MVEYGRVEHYPSLPAVRAGAGALVAPAMVARLAQSTCNSQLVSTASSGHVCWPGCRLQYFNIAACIAVVNS